MRGALGAGARRLLRQQILRRAVEVESTERTSVGVPHLHRAGFGGVPTRRLPDRECELALVGVGIGDRAGDHQVDAVGAMRDPVVRVAQEAAPVRRDQTARAVGDLLDARLLRCREEHRERRQRRDERQGDDALGRAASARERPERQRRAGTQDGALPRERAQGDGQRRQEPESRPPGGGAHEQKERDGQEEERDERQRRLQIREHGKRIEEEDVVPGIDRLPDDGDVAAREKERAQESRGAEQEPCGPPSFDGRSLDSDERAREQDDRGQGEVAGPREEAVDRRVAAEVVSRR